MDKTTFPLLNIPLPSRSFPLFIYSYIFLFISLLYIFTKSRHIVPSRDTSTSLIQTPPHSSPPLPSSPHPSPSSPSLPSRHLHSVRLSHFNILPLPVPPVICSRAII